MTKTHAKQYNKRFGADVSQTSVPFSVRATQLVSTHYICDVFDTLENLTDIEDTLFVLGIAEEHDQVTIRLNCLGGSHVVGDALIMAMNQCKAHIHAEVSGIVASYATFILLQVDSFVISPFTDFLCHGASFGFGGKMSDTKAHIDFTHNQSTKMLHYYYEHFMTPEEIDRIINGYEHYMDCDEWIERFNRRNEALASQQEECECCQQEEIIEEAPTKPVRKPRKLTQENVE